MKISKNNFTQTPGIYVWINTVNGKVYVGQSVNVLNRVQGELSMLRNGNFHNDHMQNAWNKYGEDSFAVGQLMECEIYELDDAEAAWGNHFDARNREHGYNISGYGQNNHEMADETKQKISKTMTAYWTPERRQKLSDAWTPERREAFGKKMSETQKASWTTERREAASARWTDEMKAQQREMISDYWTDEVRAARSAEVRANYDYYSKVDEIMKYVNMGLSYNEIKKLTGAPVSAVRAIVNENEHLIETRTLSKVEAYEAFKAGILTAKKATVLGKFQNVRSFKRWYNEWLIKNEN